MAKKEKTLEEAAIEAEIQETALKEVMAIKVREEAAAETAEAEKTHAEKEELIAEACRLQGRVEAFAVVSKFTTVGSLLTLKSIKEAKVYKDIPGIHTWESFCKSIGFSVNKVDEDLKNLEIFGSEFLTTVGTFGIGYRELRQLKKAASSGDLAIEADAVVIEGETIPLDDKDELKDALERVIAAKDKEIEAHVKNKDRLIKEKEQAYNEADENRQLLDKTKGELEKMRTATVGGISAADRPAYNNIRACEDRLAIVHKNLLEIADGELSEFNQQLLGGVIIMIFQVAEDVRLAINAKGGAYFERLYMSDEEIAACDKMLTPSRLNHPTAED